MDKKELRKYIKRILILGILFGLILGILLGLFINRSYNKTCENLKEDYERLKKSSNDCWNKLRILDKECWTASDCAENSDLKGCHQIEGDCNWCCYNTCTLIMCPRLNFTK